MMRWRRSITEAGTISAVRSSAGASRAWKPMRTVTAAKRSAVTPATIQRRRDDGAVPSPLGKRWIATRSATRARSRRLRGEGRTPWGPYRRERRGTVGSRRMPDVVVIGGGVVGTMAAWRLAQAGAEVTLLERGALASGATSKSQGLVLPPDHAELVPLWQES